MMKTKYIITLIAVSVLSSCADNLYTDDLESEGIIVSKTPLYLTASPDSWTFGNYVDGTTGSITAGTNWTMSGVDSSWLTVSPQSGEGGYDRDADSFKNTEVTYTTAENTTPASRTCVITVSSHTDLMDLTQQQVFTQNGITPQFDVDIPSYISNGTYVASGAVSEFEYTTNVPLEYLSVLTDAENCSGRFVNGKLELTIGENPSSSTRTIYFYIYMQEQQIDNIRLRQSGYSASVGNYQLEIPGEGGSAETTFKASVSWKAVLAESCDWLEVAPKTGTGDYEDATVTVTAKPNTTGSARSTYIYFQTASGSQLASLSIYQGEFSTTGSTKSFTGIDARGDSRIMQFSSPMAWTAASDIDWISVSPSSGSAGSNTEVSFTIAANKTSSTTRNGTVTFSDASTGSAIWTVNFSQKGASISCTSDITLPAIIDGSRASVSVSSDVDWEVISKPSWLTIEPTSGSAGDSFFYAYVNEENPSLTARSGTIEIGLPGTTITARCTAVQSGRQMVSGQAEINVDWREHAAVPLEIEVPGEWVAASSVNWATVTPASGTGNATLSIDIEANPSATARRGTIQIVSEGIPTNIPVNQGGRFLIIDTQAGEIGANGGSAEFSVSATVDYTPQIVYNDSQTDWLTLEDISADGITAYRITASANPSVNQRTAYVELASADVEGVRFNVTQSGRDIRLSATSLSISGNGGSTDDIAVDADGTYSVTSEDSWFSIITGSNNNFHLAVTPNDTGSTRYGTVTVSLTGMAGGESRSVNVSVTQNASRLDFDLNGFGPDQDWNYKVQSR